LKPSFAPILVVGPAWIGDMVMAQSLFKVLKARYPESEIDVLAPGWTQPLLERMPEVNRSLEMPLGHGELGLRVRRRIGHDLRRRRYQRAIVLPRSLKSALVPFWARIAQRSGYRGEMRWGLLNDVRRLDGTRLPRTVQRFVALGQSPGDPLPDPLPLPALRVDAAHLNAVLDRLGMKRPNRPLLGLCPGAEYGPSKRWPAEHFLSVARHQQRKGWAVWIFGSEKDKPSAARIRDGLDGECMDLTGRTDLADAVDLLSLTDVVVTNDSGLMHVAAALDRQVVALYGAFAPESNPPLRPEAIILWLGLACSPCAERTCPLGHYECLRELRPEQVIRAIDSLEIVEPRR